MGAEEKITEALTPAVGAAGLEIWDVERSGASLRVWVEKPGGADLDSISDVSRAISVILDGRDDLVPGGRYILEVSSPGLERRLRHPRHFARHVGQEVAVKTTEAFDGPRRLRGTLADASEEGITVRVDSAGPGPLDIQVPLAQVERANTVFVWPPAAKPVKAHGTKKDRSAPGRAHAAARPDDRPLAEASEQAR